MAERESVDVGDGSNHTGWILVSSITVCCKDPVKC